ncbi:hypothetical protein [Butyrivibrio sp. INlla21]|nr:hypothetical protein [Butyrivibrio sp. INlla21]
MKLDKFVLDAILVNVVEADEEYCDEGDDEAEDGEDNDEKE